VSCVYYQWHNSKNVFFLKKTVVDLGEVEQSVVEFEFVFVNNGLTPVKILGARTSCDCTIYDNKRVDVPVNASVPVRLRIFNRQDEPNDFFQDITFFYANEEPHLRQGAFSVCG
jgi:hypothetical protein